MSALPPKADIHISILWCPVMGYEQSSRCRLINRIILEPDVAHVQECRPDPTPDRDPIVVLDIHQHLDPVGGVVGCALQASLFDKLVGGTVDVGVSGHRFPYQQSDHAGIIARDSMEVIEGGSYSRSFLYLQRFEVSLWEQGRWKTDDAETSYSDGRLCGGDDWFIVSCRC